MSRKRKRMPKRIDKAKRRAMSWSLGDLDKTRMEDFGAGKDCTEEQRSCHAAKNEQAKGVERLGASDLEINVDGANLSSSLECASAQTRISFLGDISFPCNETMTTPSELILVWNANESALLLKMAFNGQENVSHLSHGQPFPCDIFLALQSLHRNGVVTVTAKQLSSENQPPGIVVELGLTERAFNAETRPTDDGGRSLYWKRLKRLVEFLYTDAVIEQEEARPLLPDIDSFYHAVRSEQRRRGLLHRNDPHLVLHSALLPELRRYQKMAVEWMIQREVSDVSATDEIHQLWKELKTSNGSSLYYNPYTGSLSRKRLLREPLPRGGILADEMGLGKTVEVLACILAHQMPDRHVEVIDNYSNGFIDSNEDDSKVLCVCGCQEEDPHYEGMWIQCDECRYWQHLSCVGLTPNLDEMFICARCWTKKDPIPCKTTLIISPSSIAYQWIEEIQKHVEPGTLSFMLYEGVAIQGFIDPLKLASYDVIVTTYQNLKQELNHVGLQYEGGHCLRHPKKYVFMPSPLLALKWWRICLDEAQMVESTSTKAAAMTSRLTAVHSWCVTGTPIQKNLEDLYGLLVFLGVTPYSIAAWWKRLLLWPYTKCGNATPLVDLMSQMLWRNAKQDVFDELQLPPHTEEAKWLTFSSIEAFFYQRQQESCLLEASKAFSKCHGNMDMSLGSLDRREVHKMMNPLLRLRQACCHPQLVRGRYINVSLQKSSVTMEELLGRLMVKTKTDCVEAHRQTIFAFNGLAGIHALKGQNVEAIETYREAMSSWEEYAEVIKTDHSQKIHTLYNLSSLLKSNPVGCGRTLRDDSLDEEVAKIKDDYMALVIARTNSATDKVESISRLVQEASSKLQHMTPWWLDVLEMAGSDGVGDQLVGEVRGMLTEAQNSGRLRQMTTVANRFRDVRGLSLVVHTALANLQTKRDKVIATVNCIARHLPTKVDIQKAAACHLRKPAIGPLNLKKCAICQGGDLFNDYEQILFAVREQNISSRHVDDGLFPEEVVDRPGAAVPRDLVTWGDSEVERILKHVASLIKNFDHSGEILTQSQTHLALLDNLKKEFRALRALWLVLDQRMAALDELEMATTRLRFREPGEPVSDPPDVSVIEIGAIEAHRMKFQSDLLLAQENLRKHLGQLRYLQTLEKSQGELTDKNTTPCPICATTLGVEWAVLTCGHCVCCSCSCYMIDRARVHRANIACPLCRFVTQPAELTYASVNYKRPESVLTGIAVRGSHSTKVEAIVECLLTIGEEDPVAKVLIFSTWVNVLDILARAMEQNDITYRLVNSRRGFQKKLTEFKQDSGVRACLMPLHSGSNGLNIVEASYVLLVEPSLNPAAEQQAVGRVYRIGQTKHTRVIRFYIDLTVESRIYELLQRKSQSCHQSASSRKSRAEAELLTLADLSRLFKDCGSSSAGIECTSTPRDTEEDEI